MVNECDGIYLANRKVMMIYRVNFAYNIGGYMRAYIGISINDGYSWSTLEGEYRCHAPYQSICARLR